MKYAVMENYIKILRDSCKELERTDCSIYIKDLALCHRKKVFRIIDPIPMTDTELFNYVNGIANHEIIQRLFMMHPDRFRSEMHVTYMNVKGKIDVYDKWFNTVIDIKVSKSQKLMLKPLKFHEEQLKSYMAIIDADDGQLLYQLNNFRSYLPFSLHMNSDQRREQLTKLESQADLLHKAIEERDPSIAKCIYDDDDLNWMCYKCQYLQRCKEMRPLDRSVIKTFAVATSIDDIKKVGRIDDAETT